MKYDVLKEVKIKGQNIYETRDEIKVQLSLLNDKFCEAVSRVDFDGIGELGLCPFSRLPAQR